MSKNNSTIKKQSKNVSRNALQVIIQELSLPDPQKVKMYEDLRNMGITDDNDPLVKFTMIQGLFAKYTGETAEKLVQERENIEATMEDVEELFERFFDVVFELRQKDLAELKDNVRIWSNETIIRTQEVITRVQNEGEKICSRIPQEQKKIYDMIKKQDEIKNSYSNIAIGTICFCIIIIIISGVILALMWKITFKNNSKTVERREAVENRETVENSKPTLKVTDSQSKWDRKYKQMSEKIKKKKHEYESNLNVANSQSELDPKYKQLLEELDNELDQKKRSEIFDKIINL